jgi:molecular chaperone GrpE
MKRRKTTMRDSEIKVTDKRFWARGDDGDDSEAAGVDDAGAAADRVPAIDAVAFEALKIRAEGAERKLREVQGAFAAAKAELDATRARLERDLDRRVEIKFADLVTDLLDSADDLDRAVQHGRSIEAAAPFMQGVVLARDRFLAALVKAGLERIDPVGQPYDPNVAEAAGIFPVSDPAAHDTVVELERAGYKLGGRVIRPARVVVGRLVS